MRHGDDRDESELEYDQECVWGGSVTVELGSKMEGIERFIDTSTFISYRVTLI